MSRGTCAGGEDFSRTETGSSAGPRPGPGAAPAAPADLPENARSGRPRPAPPASAAAGDRTPAAARAAEIRTPPRLHQPRRQSSRERRRPSARAAPAVLQGKSRTGRERRPGSDRRPPPPCISDRRKPTRPAAAAENGPERGKKGGKGPGSGTGTAPGLHFFQDRDRIGPQDVSGGGPQVLRLLNPGRTFAAARRGAPRKSTGERPRTPQSRSATSIQISILDFGFGG